MRILGILLIVLCLIVPAAADDTERTVNLKPVFKQDDVSRYNVKVRVKGTSKLPGDAEPTPIDTTLNIAISVRVGMPGTDGFIPVDIASEKASAIIAGQSMSLTDDIFPKVTAMIDKSGSVTKILAADFTSIRLPGINYRNLILLFTPNAPEGYQKPGAVWKKTIAIASERDKYEVSSVLQSFEKVDGVDVALVKSSISVIPPAGASYSAKGTVIASYSLTGAKLVQAHSEMTVKTRNPATDSPSGTPATDGPGEMDAVVTVDVVPVPSSASIGK